MSIRETACNVSGSKDHNPRSNAFQYVLWGRGAWGYSTKAYDSKEKAIDALSKHVAIESLLEDDPYGFDEVALFVDGEPILTFRSPYRIVEYFTGKSLDYVSRY